MAFCPFFSTSCPESNEGETGCAIWTSQGCCIIDKPGIPAMHGEDTVFILDIKVGEPKTMREVVVIYSDYETGVIGYEMGNNEVLDAFVVIK